MPVYPGAPPAPPYGRRGNGARRACRAIPMPRRQSSGLARSSRSPRRPGDHARRRCRTIATPRRGWSAREPGRRLPRHEPDRQLAGLAGDSVVAKARVQDLQLLRRRWATSVDCAGPATTFTAEPFRSPGVRRCSMGLLGELRNRTAVTGRPLGPSWSRRRAGPGARGLPVPPCIGARLRRGPAGPPVR